jgi:hypothetical protein
MAKSLEIVERETFEISGAGGSSAWLLQPCAIFRPQVNGSSDDRIKA